MANKIISVLLSIALLLLVSCSSTKAVSTIDYSSPVYSGIHGEKPVYTHYVLDESLRNGEGQFNIPFTENVVEIARQTGTIRYYFMAADRYLRANNIESSYLGDCTLVVFPDGTTMLIDGGISDYVNVLESNLRAMGIENLDYVVLSHMHNDHFGTLFAKGGILDQFNVGTFIWNGSYSMSQNTYNSFNSVVKRNNLNMVQVHRGDTIQIGDVRVDIYNPTDENVGEHLEETKLNNSSIAMKITYKDFSAMFAGDLYIDGEWKVINENPEGALDVDLAKANHHGRSTSSSREWIAATSPMVVYTTASPDESTYKNYAKSGTRVFCDYLDEYVRVVSDGYNCEVTTGAKRGATYYDFYDTMAKW